MDAATAPNIGAAAMLVSLIMVPVVSLLTSGSKKQINTLNHDIAEKAS